MTPILRILAAVASVSRGADRAIGGALAFLPFRVPGALLLAALLAWVGWSSANATSEEIASRPSARDAGVAALVEEPQSAWVRLTGLLSGPHLDSSVYAADRGTHYVRISDDPHDHVQERGKEPVLEPGRRQTIFQLTQGDGVTRWFYVLRDPERPDHALVVRTARDEAEVRTRSVEVEVRGELNGRPWLVELADRGSAPARSSVRDASDGPTVVRLAFGDATQVACDSGPACSDGHTWRYEVTDAGDPSVAAVVDSPHAPDALPVTLEGVVTTDPGRMALVLEADEMRAALAGSRYPEGLVLADGIGPVLPEVSYLGAILAAVVAGLLVMSRLIPYPLFRRQAPRTAGGSERPGLGELIPVEVDGRLRGLPGDRLHRAPAELGWLRARELNRRAWHLRRDDETLPSGGPPRLAIVAVEGSFLIPVDELRGDFSTVDDGLVVSATAARPGLRLTGDAGRLTLAFAGEADRDRARAEIVEGREPPAEAEILRPPEARAPASDPWARRLAAGAVGAAALLIAAGGVLSIVASGAEPFGLAIAVAGATGLVALAAGIARGVPIAQELLPSVAIVGIVVALVTAAASGTCGTWLAPSLDDCRQLGAVSLAPALLAAATFAIALWAGPRLGTPGRA